jgi:hypothetical protein
MLSAKASHDSHGQDSSYFLGWQEYEKNPYHDVHNPSGIIQMGLAENLVKRTGSREIKYYVYIYLKKLYMSHIFRVYNISALSTNKKKTLVKKNYS